MPLFARYSLSRLFVPVAVTHTSFKFFACPIDFSFTSTLFKTITSASLVRSAASSVVEKSYLTTSPSLSYSERSMSSPIVLESKNTIFMVCFLCAIYLFAFNSFGGDFAPAGCEGAPGIWYIPQKYMKSATKNVSG